MLSCRTYLVSIVCEKQSLTYIDFLGETNVFIALKYYVAQVTLKIGVNINARAKPEENELFI